MIQGSSLVTLAIAVARVTLTERARRRKLIAGVLFFLLLVFSAGNWPFSEWLSGSPWGMLCWLVGCACLALFLAMLALYDALMVLKEERAKLHRELSDSSQDSGDRPL